MEKNKIERLRFFVRFFEGKFSVALAVGFFAVGIGYNLNSRWLFYAGLILLGIGAAGRGVIGFSVTRENNFPRKKIAIFSGYCIALFQIIFGALIVVGTIAEITSKYISSGNFWRDVMSALSPLLIFFIIGFFFTLAGLSLMGSVEKSEQKTVKSSLQNLLDISQGIIPFIFGLILIGLIFFVIFFR